MNAYIVNYNSFNQKYGIVIAANEERAWKKLLKDIQSRDEKIGEGINNLESIKEAFYLENCQTIE